MRISSPCERGEGPHSAITTTGQYPEQLLAWSPRSAMVSFEQYHAVTCDGDTHHSE